MPKTPLAPDPYRAPGGDPAAGHPTPEMLRRVRFWRRTLQISAAGVLIPPILGLAGFLIGVQQAFATLSATGQADPAALANDISTSLLSAMWAVLFSLLALAVLIPALFMHRHSKRALAAASYRAT
jgi:biopolymer transport protein ExbB/TolQ